MIRVAFKLICVAVAGLATGAAILALPASALEFDRLRMLTTEEHKAWRGVGRVNIARFSERGMCTGTLIDEDIVLTAAHCLISDRTGQPHEPGNVHFVAGWRRGQRVGHSTAAEIYIHSGYVHGGGAEIDQVATDVALIRLKQRIPDAAAPAFAIAASPKNRHPLTLISYRRDRAHALTRQDGCEILGEKGAVMALGCDVTFGASGSPLFVETNGEQRLVGVISGMSRSNGRPIAWAVKLDAALGDVLNRLP